VAKRKEQDNQGRADTDERSVDETYEESGDGESLAIDPFESTSNSGATYPIVAIGASAGGFEALELLLRNYSASGLALVFIQHLGAKQETHLPQLLRRITSIPVIEAEEGVDIQPDKVYVIPAGHFNILNRKLVKLDGEALTSSHSIDVFFRSLAQDVGSAAIGVILSGMGSDGALGLRAIKEAGGITFAHDKTAKFDGMPSSAVAEGIVDFILPPAEIARELKRISGSPLLRELTDPQHSNTLFHKPEELDKLFLLLRNSTGLDFSKYKETTIRRRIYRRMVLSKIDRLETYISYLSHNPAELATLFDDLLINVTSFFRDPESFEVLKRQVFPHIVAQRSTEFPIRVWVAGCSTGEEVYSVAIALSEFLGDMVNTANVQIFGTDVSDNAISHARKGLYPETIAQDVSPERLRKYFKRIDGGYQISKSIRDICVFARQNMVKDPPFSRLDLITCRNVMIYLGPSLQKQVIRTFHQALQPNGYLMLGTSETIGSHAELFHLIDKKNKVYLRKSALTRIPPVYANAPMNYETKPHTVAPVHDYQSSNDFQKEAEKAILSLYAPPGVIIDDDLNILHFRGFTGLFLEPAPGTPSHGILRMVREGLRLDLRSAIIRAKRTGAPVRKERVEFMYGDKPRHANICVIPIASDSSKQQWLLVLFEEAHLRPDELESTEVSSTGRSRSSAVLERQIKSLQQELADTKEYLQRSVEEQDAYNEELKSANEEIQSSNEELQSTNEELETAKEELQSINEELTTLNDELQLRNIELTQANNDLNNLLANVNFMVVMVGIDHRIRRFNPIAEKILNIIPSDIGRPIGDIRPNLVIEDLEVLIERVIDSLNVVEREVQDRTGKWYSLSIRPYKTTDNKIEGAVISLIDIDALKRSLAGETQSREFVQAMLDVVPSPLLVLQAGSTIELANRAFYSTFGYRRIDAKNNSLFNLGNGVWDTPAMHNLLDEVAGKPGSLSETAWTGVTGEDRYTIVARCISELDTRVLLSVNRESNRP
jgi:two-component system, chemotaxis family, CheB/CheR fusion protein